MLDILVGDTHNCKNPMRIGGSEGVNKEFIWHYTRKSYFITSYNYYGEHYTIAR